MTNTFDKLSCIKTDIINQKYLVKYCKIISHFKSRDPILGNIHRHHIIPRCMMLELQVAESIENLVNLTPREHKFVHNVLSHAFPTHKIRHAFNLKFSKNKIAVIDKLTGNSLRIDTDEYYQNKDRYSTHSAGFTNLISPDGINTRVSVAEVEYYKSIGYVHTMQGKKKSAEFSEKLRHANLGKTHSEETKKILSDINLGKTPSDETKKKISIANTGRKRSDETKAKISKANKGLGIGRKLSAETLTKVSATRKLLIWINNGIINKRILEKDMCKYPEFKKGRFKKGRFKK